MKWFKVADETFTYEGKILKRIIYNEDIGDDIKKGDKGPWVEFPERIKCREPIICVGDVFILGSTGFQNTCGAIRLEDSVVRDCVFKNDKTCSVSIKNSQISSVHVEKTNIENDLERKILISDSKIKTRNPNNFFNIINRGTIIIEKSEITSSSAIAKIESYYETSIYIKNTFFENFGISVKTDLSRDSSISINNVEYYGNGDVNILVNGKATIRNTVIQGIQIIFVKDANIANCNLCGTVSVYGKKDSNISLIKSTLSDFAKIVVDDETQIIDSIVMNRAMIVAYSPTTIKKSIISGCARIDNANISGCIIQDKTIVENVSIEHFEIKNNSRIGSLITGETIDPSVFYPKTTIVGGSATKLYVIEKQSDFYMMQDLFDENIVLACLPKTNEYVLLAANGNSQVNFLSLSESVRFVAKKVLDKKCDEDLVHQIADKFVSDKETRFSVSDAARELIKFVPLNKNNENFIENSLLFFWFSFFRSLNGKSGFSEDKTDMVLQKIIKKSRLNIKNKKPVLDENIRLISNDVLDVLLNGKEITLPNNWIVVS